MSTTEELLAGIALIRKYEPEAEFAAEHDVIYFGSYESKVQMTESEQENMET